jgi:putative flippase GtrA
MTMQQLYRRLFIDKADRGIIQLFRYGFVGGLSAVVDIGTLFFCTSVLHIHYLISAALAFVLGTIVNYLLSVAWVFTRSKNFKVEFMLFTLIGLGGLGLNELILWLLVSKVHIFYLLAKLFSVSVVVIWSFTLRRLLFARLGAASTNQTA